MQGQSTSPSRETLNCLGEDSDKDVHVVQNGNIKNSLFIVYGNLTGLAAPIALRYVCNHYPQQYFERPAFQYQELGGSWLEQSLVLAISLIL
ncbi:MAG: hypothetical protein ACI845_003050 [Gammaproteobacteria bacterium]|jgi:hypothetical protein